MVVEGKQVDEGRLWETLGSLGKGVSNLEDGQKQINGKVSDICKNISDIKADCNTRHTALNARVGRLEQPVTTSPDIDIDLSKGKINIKKLDQFTRRAVWLVIIYLFLESIGIIPEDWVKNHLPKRVELSNVVEEQGHSL